MVSDSGINMPRVPDIWPNYNHSFAGPSLASSLCRLFTLYTSPNFLPCSRNNYNGRQRFKSDHPWAKASDAFIQSVVGRFNIHVSLYSVLRLKADIAACCLVVCTPVLNLMWLFFLRRWWCMFRFNPVFLWLLLTRHMRHLLTWQHEM